MDKVKFDPVTHTYWLENGKELPSVTRIIREAGLMDRLPDDAGEAMRRGSMIHAYAEAIDNGQALEDAESEYEPYLAAWQSFKELSKVKFIDIERVVWSSRGYAGMLDRRAKLNGDKYLLDIKTGNVPSWSVAQLAAYKATRPEFKDDKLAVVQLKPTGKFSLIEYNCAEEAEGKQVFLAALVIWKWKN